MNQMPHPPYFPYSRYSPGIAHVTFSFSSIWNMHSKDVLTTQQLPIWWKISKNLFSTASSMSKSHAFILLWRVVESISKHSKNNFATHPVAWVKGHLRTFRRPIL
jgi:hypothetical protein